MLSQLLVTRYAKYQALKNLLDTWLEEKRKEILLALAKGKCPERGPYLLQVGEVNDSISWREAFASYLVKQGSTEAEAETKLLEIAAARVAQKVPRLYCKRNPNYHRAFPIRLPK